MNVTLKLPDDLVREAATGRSINPNLFPLFCFQ
jgi:hypothetical protein